MSIQTTKHLLCLTGYQEILQKEIQQSIWDNRIAVEKTSLAKMKAMNCKNFNIEKNKMFKTSSTVNVEEGARKKQKEHTCFTLRPNENYEIPMEIAAFSREVLNFLRKYVLFRAWRKICPSSLAIA